MLLPPALIAARGTGSPYCDGPASKVLLALQPAAPAAGA